MATRRLAVGCSLSIAYLLFGAAASAQDSATAGALFEKGVADLEAGRFASACPAIEESQRLDPRPGTLFTLAECHARAGKVASAVAEYQEYVDLVPRLTREQQQRHKARVDVAREQLAKLKPSVPTLTLVLPPDAPSGTFVTRNGEVLKGAALGLPLPVDPGEYVIVTHVPGVPERETKVSLQLGEAKSVPLDTSTPVAGQPAQSAPPVAVAQAGSSVQTPRAVSPSEPAHGSGRKTAAYVAGGVGVAGLAVGAVAGILVLGKTHTVSDNCAGHACNDAGLAAADSGKKLALISDVAFGIGIAGVAAGAILLLTGGSASTESHAGQTPRWQPLLVTGNSGFATGVFRRW